MTSKQNSDEIMHASLRECRMVVERLCQSIGIRDGLLRSLTDCGVYSAALGLSGFRGLERQLELLKSIDPKSVSVGTESEPILINSAGQHAWVVAETALDLAVASYRLTGHGAVAIVNANEPSELGVLRALAEKHGLKVEVDMDSGGRVLARLSDRAAGTPTILDGIVREGIEVSRELWFRLFHRSHDALAADTVVSRTHTGSIIVKPDGTILGKEDPEFIDTDLSMLTKEAIVEPAFIRETTGTRERTPGGG